MPLPPPVISATLPLSFILFISLVAERFVACFVCFVGSYVPQPVLQHVTVNRLPPAEPLHKPPRLIRRQPQRQILPEPSADAFRKSVDRSADKRSPRTPR